MSRTFLTADTHFNHPFVARTRGYSTAAEHDEAVLAAINETCGKRDHLWILGDLFMGSVTLGLEKLARIVPTVHVVLGNHDAAHPMHRGSVGHMKRLLASGVIDSVHLGEELRTPAGHRVQLSHFPFAGEHSQLQQDRHVEWRPHDTGQWLLHGHIHKARTSAHTKQFNVGIDQSIHPFAFADLATMIDTIEDHR